MIWKTMYTEYIEDDPGFSMYISDLGTQDPIMVKLGECMNELMSMFDLEACGSNGPLFLRAERFSDVASCLARQTHALAQLETIQQQLNEAISQAGSKN
jgi:predicted small lipoprotein YifL